MGTNFAMNVGNAGCYKTQADPTAPLTISGQLVDDTLKRPGKY